jgi:hypothetical protein
MFKRLPRCLGYMDGLNYKNAGMLVKQRPFIARHSSHHVRVEENLI